uniref:S_100 domain-containing protein n=1 Tax=Meloidogyne hapla TaxID=6305 RepID=A0A1I8BFP9_MELHA
MTLILFGILSISIGTSSINSPCADQLQRCSLLVEEFERQLHDLKNSAFRNDFFSAAEDFQSEVEQCFSNGGKTLEEPAEINTTESGDSQLLGAIFGTELADRLWGLPNGELDRKEKETISQSDSNNHVFGGGISRIAPQQIAADQLSYS